MTNTLKIAKSATSSIDIPSITGNDYTEPDEPSPNYQRETRNGCGASGSRLVRRTLIDMSIPIVIYAKGADGNTRFDLRDTVLADLEAAVAYEIGDTESINYDGQPRYLQRVVDNQSPADWFQIMDYDVGFPMKRSHNRFVMMAVTLKVWPGQKIPANADLTGLTITRVYGGIGRVVLGSDGFPVTIGTL